MTTSQPTTYYTYADGGNQVTINAWDARLATLADPSVAISVTTAGDTLGANISPDGARRLARALKEAADVAEGSA